MMRCEPERRCDGRSCVCICIQTEPFTQADRASNWAAGLAEVHDDAKAEELL